jgi:uncharacterized membrane protein (TIGR02234 family)
MSRDRRALGLVCLALVGSAGALWGGSRLVWYRVTAPLPLRGPVDVEFTGAQVLPALPATALLALAGVAAVVAVGGAVRRILGALLAVVGAFVVGAGLLGWSGSPFDTDTDAGGAGLPQPPPGIPVDALRHQPTEITAAPLLAALGGLLLVAAGLVVVLSQRRLPRLGARYTPPGDRSPPTDPDRAAWQDLDEGRDPTAPHPTAPGTRGRS